MALKNLSHLVVATPDVPNISQFFSQLFGVSAYFENAEFCEFVLPSGFRVAFFRPVGKSARFFANPTERSAVAFGVTVADVEATYQKALALGATVSGPPKDHPWGEKSFLLIDPDNNRWEVTHSPSADGFLVNR